MAKSKNVFPEDATFGTYFPVKEGSNWRIKRMVTLPNGRRAAQRLDRKSYLHVANTYEAMLQHCDRVNFGVNMKKQREIEIQSAFLPPHLLENFKAELLVAIPNRQYAIYLFDRALKEYFLHFFIERLKLPDPSQWPKRQTDWGVALMGQYKAQIFDDKASARTITLVIQTANRFLRFIHQQMPETYPLIRLSPISKAALKKYEADQKREPIGKFISEPDWKEIKKNLPDDISPFIQLMYNYGLRRSESLGFKDTEAVRKSHLNVSEQLVSVGNEPKFGPLKSREQRKTPHWFCEPAQVYKLVTASLTKKMHPDTLSEKFDQLMRDLGMEYRLHDFRRTFITRALRKYNPRDVQLAVGHTDLRTTMKYAKDDRELDDNEVFIPTKAG